MAGPRLPGELTWPKLLGTCIAAVVTAWLAGYLNLGGTLTGVAIGSVIATFGSAFFTHTIDKTQQVIPTVLVRTERGSVVEARADSDVVVEDGAGDTSILPAQDEPPAAPMSQPAIESRWSRIQWKSVAIASVITMALTLGAISIYEGAVGRTWGSNEPGTSIGNTVRGGPQTPAAETPTPTPTPSEEPTEEPSESPTPTTSPTPTPTPTASPTPTPTPSPSPTATDCPTPATPTDPASPGTEPAECPTPESTPTEDGGLLP